MIRILFVLCGFFWAMININSYPFVIDMAPKGQVGKYTGLYYIASSVAAIVSPPLLGFVIDIIGYKYMFVYGTIFFILSLIFISKVKKVTE
jgi:MFS family permease